MFRIALVEAMALYRVHFLDLGNNMRTTSCRTYARQGLSARTAISFQGRASTRISWYSTS